jgi:hypothetical protein
MRILRVVSALGVLALASLPLISADAWAGKAAAPAAGEEKELPKIEMTGISQFDSVFSRAKTIQDTLDTSHGDLQKSRENVKGTLGIATDAPLATAFADLKTKAQGKVKVAMKGNRPALEATDAVPDNVKAGIDATNQLLDQAEKTAMTAKGLVPEATELIAATADFPSQIPGLAKDPMAAAKATKTVAANLKTIKGTPERISRMVTDVESIYSDVKAAFMN